MAELDEQFNIIEVQVCFDEIFCFEFKLNNKIISSITT